jgi:hypothetical protein
MLPLFDEARTFAAARQVSFQGWLKSVLPSAPFRVLRPDEASPVGNPSRTVLPKRMQRFSDSKNLH